MILDINDIWERERASRGKWSLSHDTGYQQIQFGQGFFVRFKHVGGR